MAVFKCKMCGGSLEVTEGMTVCECEYCGTKQTIPKSHDDVLTNNFNRANNLRMKNEFDKAQELYEKIVSANPTEAEAYWGIVLCKYGIEYVEDPTTLKKIPTCHRTQYESVVSDVDYLSAIENADAGQKELFEKEAAEIDKLQKNILEIVHKEKPFDVFICYKETDENGKRTPDSVIANDIYYQLTQEGFKVFYAAITLEDKLGQEYEPYIFAALNSAKVMLVIGSKPEYFNAVWVKNEWSRYLKLMKSDRSKLLIPCYKDMDAYDLPEEFSHLQAQDMSKIGFINDVIRGLKKILTKQSNAPITEVRTEPRNDGGNIDVFLKRGQLALEDGEWRDAKEYCEKVLDIDPENSAAYTYKFMAEMRIDSLDKLSSCKTMYGSLGSYRRMVKSADSELKSRLERINKKWLYNWASDLMKSSKIKQIEAAQAIFMYLNSFEDSNEMTSRCKKRITDVRNKEICDRAEKALVERRYYNESDIKLIKDSIAELEDIEGWKNSKELLDRCRSRLSRIPEINHSVDTESKAISVFLFLGAMVVLAIVCYVVYSMSAASYH